MTPGRILSIYYASKDPIGFTSNITTGTKGATSAGARNGSAQLRAAPFLERNY